MARIGYTMSGEKFVVKGYKDQAYALGAEARKRGDERKSPYLMCNSELYWYAGYDGVPYDEWMELTQ